MPNKILSIVLDTPINPQNIQKQIITKKNKKTKNSESFSKEASEASKAYALSQIKRREHSRYTAVKLLDEGLKAKEEAKEIYYTSFDKLRNIDGHKLLKEARNNGFNTIYDENGNIKKAFEYTKRHGKKPDTLTVYEYENNELIREVTIKDNGIYVSSITNYSGNNFERMKFITGAYRGSDIYEYTVGRNMEDGVLVDRLYKFSNSSFGQITEYRKGVKINSDGTGTTHLVVKYNNDGKCQSAQENILYDATGKVIGADPEIKFQCEKNFYVMNFND